jgi:hypothetical protein
MRLDPGVPKAPPPNSARVTRNRGLGLLAVLVIAAAIAGCEGDEDKASTESAKKPAAACAHCFTDDFSGPNQGWPTVSDDEHAASRTGGVYRYTLKKPGLQKLAGPDQFDADGKRLHFADSVVSVSAKVATANELPVGVVCRWRESEGSAPAAQYVFAVFQDRYEVRRYQEGKEFKRLDVGLLPEGTDLSRPTKLEAACKGDSLTFSVDGKRVSKVRDSSIASGSDGLYIASAGDVPATAVFDDYEVR